MVKDIKCTIDKSSVDSCAKATFDASEDGKTILKTITLAKDFENNHDVKIPEVKARKNAYRKKLRGKEHDRLNIKRDIIKIQKF